MANRRVRRGRPRRTAPAGRRRADVYYEVGKFAGLIACVTTAILGQAELVGEPWRHVIAVTAIGATAAWAYCMRPASARALMQLWRHK